MRPAAAPAARRTGGAPLRHPRRPALLLAAVLTVVLTGCGDEPADPAPSAPAAPSTEAVAPASVDASAGPAASATPSPDVSVQDAPDESFVLTAVVDQVPVHASPGGEVAHTLDNPRDTGAPLTFLMTDDTGGGWYEVMVPVRPNGTTGFVRAQDVGVARITHRLVMSTRDNELTVYEGDEVLRTMPAASGTGDTPTPLGSFYLTELLEPTNAGYGPYAYGLSGFSEVLTSFGGGPGQIGLHGTDDADSVGRAVSHGCIRLSDEDITYLAELLPLGTPIDVV